MYMESCGRPGSQFYRSLSYTAYDLEGLGQSPVAAYHSCCGEDRDVERVAEASPTQRKGSSNRPRHAVTPLAMAPGWRYGGLIHRAGSPYRLQQHPDHREQTEHAQ